MGCDRDHEIYALEESLAHRIGELGELYGYITRAVIGVKWPGRNHEERELFNMLVAKGKIEVAEDGTMVGTP